MNNLSYVNLFQPSSKITCVDDYIPYRYTKAFIQQKYQAVPKNIRETVPENYKEWMSVLGYGNVNKFFRRLKEEWLELKGSIPVKLLDLLNTDIDILTLVVNLDKDCYHETLKYANKPRYFQYRIAPCVYPVKELPDNISEPEAILYVQDFLKELGLNKPAAISYGYLKNILVSDTSHTVKYEEPRIIIENGCMRFPILEGCFSVRF